MNVIVNEQCGFCNVSKAFLAIILDIKVGNKTSVLIMPREWTEP